MNDIVHYLRHGHTPCGIQGLPKDWPPGNLWSGEAIHVTCEACRAGLDSIGILTFEIDPEGKWIKCRGCGLTSYLAADVSHHFCGHCHVFHDDIWPPARKWWIEHTPKVVDANGRRIPGAKVGIERDL